MIAKNATPVERILASLEESSEAENYSASDIEVLPIAEITTRLDELGIDSSPSPCIESVASGYVRPSQKIIDTLSEDQGGQDDEIERLSLDDVTAKLNNTGLNHLAGLERVRELVGATETSADDGEDGSALPPVHKNVVPLVRRNSSTARRVSVMIAWIAAVAAVIVFVCNTEYEKIQLQRKYAGLEEEYVDLSQQMVKIQLRKDLVEKGYAELSRKIDGMAEVQKSNMRGTVTNIVANLGYGTAFLGADDFKKAASSVSLVALSENTGNVYFCPTATATGGAMPIGSQCSMTDGRWTCSIAFDAAGFPLGASAPGGVDFDGGK